MCINMYRHTICDHLIVMCIYIVMFIFVYMCHISSDVCVYARLHKVRLNSCGMNMCMSRCRCITLQPLSMYSGVFLMFSSKVTLRGVVCDT